MIKNKKRILFCTEASWLNTGYAIYSNQLMNELYNSNKYELFELSCYGDQSDKRMLSVPWKCYPNLPKNDEEQRTYDSCPTNVFGEWKFEETCLDCKADCVIDLRDNWMNKYQFYSPFRRHYNLIHMPTVDAEPLEEDWVADYISLDGVLAYTSWGHKILSKYINKDKIFGIAPGGTDVGAFHPVQDKEQHKEKLGIRKDTIIFGMVARNQVRKLIPELLRAFSKFFYESNHPNKDKVFLYLHTSYPDVGWDIPRLLNMYNIAHKVIFTYSCQNCNNIMPLIYQDIRIICPKCHKATMSLPTVTRGISAQDLGIIYNIFDVYIQYASMEGLGISQIEAAYCGLPIISVNYAGMSDIVSKLKAKSVEPLTFTFDHLTGRKMAVPNEEQLIGHIKDYCSMPSNLICYNGKQTEILAHKYFNWHDSAKSWMLAIDSMTNKNSWSSPPRYANITDKIPHHLDPENFVKWCIFSLLNRPELVNTYWSLKLTRDLYWQIVSDQKISPYYNDMSLLGLRPKYRNFSSQYDAQLYLVNDILQMCEHNNKWESIRAKACNNTHSI